jgi:hypothetical protein
LACIDAVKGYDPVINDKKVKVLNALTKHGPCTMRDLYKKAGLKKQDTGMVMQWARDGGDSFAYMSMQWAFWLGYQG